MNALKLHEAEDFGCAFNCTIRMYMRNFDGELLETIVEACDRYLSVYSYRTLICALRDLQDFSYPFVNKQIPEHQQGAYEYLLKRLTRQGLTLMKTNGRPYYIGEEERWIAFAKEAELLHSPLNQSRFLTVKEYVFWIKENQLMMPADVRNVTGDMLYVHGEELQLIYKIVETMMAYSLGRLSYMPSLCMDFIRKNITLFDDNELHRIQGLALNYLNEAEKSDNWTDSYWKEFADEIEGELTERNWCQNAKSHPKSITELLDSIVKDAEIKTYREWIMVNHAYKGIERYTKSLPKSKRDTYKKPMKTTHDIIGKYAHRTWLKEEGYKYDRVGKNTYILNKLGAHSPVSKH